MKAERRILLGLAMGVTLGAFAQGDARDCRTANANRVACFPDEPGKRDNGHKIEK